MRRPARVPDGHRFSSVRRQRSHPHRGPDYRCLPPAAQTREPAKPAWLASYSWNSTFLRPIPYLSSELGGRRRYGMEEDASQLEMEAQIGDSLDGLPVGCEWSELPFLNCRHRRIHQDCVPREGLDLFDDAVLSDVGFQLNRALKMKLFRHGRIFRLYPFLGGFDRLALGYVDRILSEGRASHK